MALSISAGLSSGCLDSFLSHTSIIGVVFLFVSSRVIIILMVTSLIFPPIVFLINRCHLGWQLLILILELSNYLIQSLYGRRLGDVLHLIPILVIMLVVLVVLIMLVVGNMLSHVHTLTPYGDHSPFVGMIFGPVMGANVLTCFLRLSDIVLCNFELSRMLLQ